MGAEAGTVQSALAREGRHDHALAVAYFVVAIGVISFYGIRVCPFIDSLDPWSVVATFTVAFGVALAVKLLFEERLMPDGEPFTLSVYQFFIDFGLFLLVGLAVAFYNRWAHGFPMESGYKVMVGCAMFGIFAGLDNGLRRERLTPPVLDNLSVPPKTIFPITRRLTVIFLGIALLTGIVTALVVIKDIDYLIENIDIEPHAHLRRAVFADVGFILGVVTLLSLRLMWAYGNNLRYMLNLEIDGLTDVSQGRLDTFVPVVTRDEFSLIATKTNQMIERLRRANRAQKEMFEVSLALARVLQLDQLLERIVAATREIVEADRVSIFLHDRETDELWSRVAEGTDEELRFPSDHGIAGDVFTSGQSAIVLNAYRDPRFNQSVDSQTGYRTDSVLCVPIIDRDGEIIGVIQALNRIRFKFDETDEERLRGFAAQVAVALVNAQLFSDLDRMRRYNESILQSLSNGVVTLDQQQVVVKANEAALRILGQPAALQGQAFLSALGDGNDWWAALWEDQAESYLADTEIVLADGTSRSANIMRVPLSDLDDNEIGSMLVLEDVTEEKRIRNTMSRYLPSQVAEQVLSDAENQLGGVNQIATVLFSDIRNFTTISERLGPKDTVSMLNEYFSAMVDTIAHNNGILDKYIGDAIMAVFGVPFAGDTDADNAVRASLEMLERLDVWNVERRDRNQDPIDIGIGLSTGDVVAGNVGSARRMDYTVIGDTVNLSARLESATKAYGVRLLISGKTADALNQDHPLRELDRIRVKGKGEPVSIYQVLSPVEVLPETAIEAFRAGREAYAEREWALAIKRFERVLSQMPDDGPSQLLISRCRRLERVPPPDEWDGVWELK